VPDRFLDESTLDRKIAYSVNTPFQSKSFAYTRPFFLNKL